MEWLVVLLAVAASIAGVALMAERARTARRSAPQDGGDTEPPGPSGPRLYDVSAGDADVPGDGGS